MMLTRWVGDTYYMAYSDAKGFFLKSAYGSQLSVLQWFAAVDELIEQLLALTAEKWWSSGSVTLFDQHDVDFFLATEQLRTKNYGAVVDYTGKLPFRYLQSGPEGEGQYHILTKWMVMHERRRQGDD